MGLSMGGVVARHAAAPQEGSDRPRLRVRRLFTIVTPHSGAARADRIGFFGTARAMRTGSPFLRRLARRERTGGVAYERLVAYARHRDQVVGVPGAKLPPHLNGQVLWFDSPWFRIPHSDADQDPRILADLSRRLLAGN